jgi:hypothetical protein
VDEDTNSTPGSTWQDGAPMYPSGKAATFSASRAIRSLGRAISRNSGSPRRFGWETAPPSNSGRRPGASAPSLPKTRINYMTRDTFKWVNQEYLVFNWNWDTNHADLIGDVWASISRPFGDRAWSAQSERRFSAKLDALTYVYNMAYPGVRQINGLPVSNQTFAGQYLSPVLQYRGQPTADTQRRPLRRSAGGRRPNGFMPCSRFSLPNTKWFPICAWWPARSTATTLL